MDLRLSSNEASRPVARKPSGWRVFCLCASLARPLQPAAGMLGPRRLAHSQNPSPQHPSQFSDRLLRKRQFLLIKRQPEIETKPRLQFFELNRFARRNQEKAHIL